MSLLQPTTWPGVGRLLGRKTVDNGPGPSVILRAGRSLGIWQAALGQFIPRAVNPHFYEALREALPVLDGAVNRMIALDGILGVEGDNDRLVQLIERELFGGMPVNDEEVGLQAFYASVGNELYEQGLGAGEMVFDRRGRELIALRVADSKGIAFDRDDKTLALRWWYRPPTWPAGGRGDGTDQVEAVIRGRAGAGATTSVGAVLSQHNYVPLEREAMVYSVLMPEADNPYGVSLFRSMEFIAQLLLKIENATGQVWDRFGDPPYHLTYKVKNRVIAGDQAALDRRKAVLARDLAAVLNAKRNGNSADFVQAIAADDEITLAVIGAKDEALEIEMPARHMLEQIVAKTGIASWALGFHWSTAERLAEQQSELMLQDSRVRFTKRVPGLNRIVQTWLRGRGLTWKPGDWRLVQQLPSLHDELKRAQSAFLRAQTELMQSGALAGQQGTPRLPVSRTESEAADEKAVTLDLGGGFRAHFPARKAVKSESAAAGEDWAEDDPQLPLIEHAAIAGMLRAWTQLQAQTRSALGLPEGKGAKTVSFAFTPLMRVALHQLADEYEREGGAAQAALMRGMVDAWLRGAANAAAEIDAEAALDAARTAAEAALRAHGMQMVQNVVARTYRSGIIDELASGVHDGLHPDAVARELRERFGAKDYDWERLARSEIAQAQAEGKEWEYREIGVERYDYVTAGDERVSTICRMLADAGPYPVGSGPLPMRDSHPNCRCTTLAVIE
jgi:SPP1 gp7 family putative phage head morphogenesis protein